MHEKGKSELYNFITILTKNLPNPGNIVLLKEALQFAVKSLCGAAIHCLLTDHICNNNLQGINTWTFRSRKSSPSDPLGFCH